MIPIELYYTILEGFCNLFSSTCEVLSNMKANSQHSKILNRAHPLLILFGLKYIFCAIGVHTVLSSCSKLIHLCIICAASYVILLCMWPSIIMRISVTCAKDKPSFCGSTPSMLQVSGQDFSTRRFKLCLGWTSRFFFHGIAPCLTGGFLFTGHFILMSALLMSCPFEGWRLQWCCKDTCRYLL
jgi:hypothetical protein